jgi:hypothetical protein
MRLTGQCFEGHPVSRRDWHRAKAVLVSPSLSQDVTFPAHPIVNLRTPGKKNTKEIGSKTMWGLYDTKL